MNPNSMEFAHEESSETPTEEALPGVPGWHNEQRLAHLQREERAMRAFLEDCMQPEPRDFLAKQLRLRVCLGQAHAAWQIWEEARKRYPDLLPYFENDEHVLNVFGNNTEALDEMLKQLLDRNGEPGAIYDNEFEGLIARLMEQREAELRAQADANRQHQAIVDVARTERRRAQRVQVKRQRMGPAQRVPLRKRQLGSPQRVPQPRDEHGRFTDNDSKGKGEL